MSKIVLLDIDGVLTDGTVSINSRGEESKTISFDDIDAIFALKRNAIKIGFMTGEDNQFTEYVRRRFTPDFLVTGCKDKLAGFKKLAKEASLSKSDVCYLGDSQKDIALLQFLPHSFAPGDADAEVKSAAKIVLKATRGRGAIKELVRYVLAPEKDKAPVRRIRKLIMQKGKQVEVIAIIPARGGSKGVPKKNIQLLGGYPLIAYSVVAATMSKEIERCIVSTDSEEIADIARHYGAEVPFLRPSKFAGDKSTDNEWVLHLIDWLEKNERHVAEFLVHLRPTTPFREPDIIDSAIAEIRKRPEAESLRSAYPASESPFKWFIRDNKGYFKGILSGLSNDEINKPRQSFPDVYIPDGYVDILKTSFIRKSGVLHGEKMIGFISPVCHEVDTVEDLDFLKFDLERKGSPLYDYLKLNFPSGG